MKIDWFTAAAQIINLFILIWLLQRFLYQPILDAMNRRRQKIAESLQKAEEKQQEAEKEKRHYQDLQEKIEQEADEKLQKARQEAESLGERLMAEANNEVKEARHKWLKELDREKEQFLIRTSRTIAEEFSRLQSVAFKELANRDFEEQMVKIFLEKTRKGEQKELLVSLKYEEKENILVTSSFELNSTLQQQIREHLQQIYRKDLTIEFETDPDLLAGITVEVEGKRVGWHLSDYLDNFNDRLKDSLEKNMQ